MKEKLLSLLNELKTWVLSVWASVSAYVAKVSAPVLSVLGIVGVVLAIAKYRDLFIKFISWKTKNEIASTEKQDSVLDKKESDDKQLEQQFETEADNEPNPGDDWYKQ